MIQNINLDKSQVSAELHGYMYDAIHGNSGVFDYGNKLEYELVSNNEIKIKDGLILNCGRFMRVVGTESIAIENGVSGTTRYDLIVAHFETDGINEMHDIRIIKGDSDGTLPTPTQEEIYNGGTVYELPLYSIYINGLNVEAITKLFSELCSIGELEQNISNPNIIFNADFRSPINTKGSEAYAGTEPPNETIDGWYMGANDFGRRITLNSGYITLDNPNETYDGTFYQPFDRALPNDIYTASLMVKSIAKGSGILSIGGNEVLVKEGLNSITFTGAPNSFVIRTNPKSNLSIEYAKLEKGSRATNFTTYLNIENATSNTVSSGSDYGEVALWADDNPSGEDRLYRFVTIVGDNREIALADSSSQIVGTSNIKENVGFLGNYTNGAENDPTKAIVSILGVSFVKTNDSSIVANDRVMSDDHGYAVKSSNNLGYRVLANNDNLLEIVVSPNTDMIQRIRTDMVAVEASVGNVETSLGGMKLISLTQAEYDTLETKDESTIYFVVGE